MARENRGHWREEYIGTLFTDRKNKRNKGRKGRLNAEATREHEKEESAQAGRRERKVRERAEAKDEKEADEARRGRGAVAPTTGERGSIDAEGPEGMGVQAVAPLVGRPSSVAVMGQGKVKRCTGPACCGGGA